MQVIIELLELSHLALMLNSTFRSLRQLRMYDSSNNGLSLLNLFKGMLAYQRKEFRQRWSHFTQIFPIVIISHSKYHIQTFLCILLWNFKYFPKFISSKSWRLTYKIFSFDAHLPQKRNQMLLNVMKNGKHSFAMIHWALKALFLNFHLKTAERLVLVWYWMFSLYFFISRLKSLLECSWVEVFVNPWKFFSIS